MKNSTKIQLMIALCLSIFTFSQTIVKVDSINGNELIIKMDSRTNDYFNKQKCTPTKVAPVKRQKRQSRKISTRELCRRNPVIMGYKILVGVKRNRKEANQLKADFRKKFPRMKVMLDASLRPNYKILADSFFDRKTGKPYLRKVRRSFPSATLVKYKIYCVEGK